MLHACVFVFDVTGNLKKFDVLAKQGLDLLAVICNAFRRAALTKPEVPFSALVMRHN